MVGRSQPVPVRAALREIAHGILEPAAVERGDHRFPGRITNDAVRGGGTALIVMRIQQPEPERMFKAPAWSLVGAGAGPILGGLYLFVSLPVATGQDAAA